jgi:hypothetical protein
VRECGRQVHGGRARVTEHPSAEAAHQEENHKHNRRDREVIVCAVRSIQPCFEIFHAYSSVVLADNLVRRVCPIKRNY